MTECGCRDTHPQLTHSVGPALVLTATTREVDPKPGAPLPSTLRYPLETREKEASPDSHELI